MTPSLYSICLHYIVENNNELTSLEGVPFKPFVQDILQGLFHSEKPLDKSTLSLIGKAHGSQLSQVRHGWTSVSLSLLTPANSGRLAFQFLSNELSSFIVSLDLSNTDVSDEQIHLLKHFSHLQTLDLSRLIFLTDIGLLYLSLLKLPLLKRLELADNRGITDKSLSYLSSLDLDSIDLSNTLILEKVADIYLARFGFSQARREPDQSRPCPKLHCDIRLMLIQGHQFGPPSLIPEKEFYSKKKSLFYKRMTETKKRKTENFIKKETTKPTLDDYWALISSEFL
ncbi:hypothetical protein G6F56_011599 [Rhizopus delemar]|nr:hypothetical protein G6F56_011599 [Rhizopus delemar]